jgi:hypothetical protein
MSASATVWEDPSVTRDRCFTCEKPHRIVGSVGAQIDKRRRATSGEQAMMQEKSSMISRAFNHIQLGTLYFLHFCLIMATRVLPADQDPEKCPSSRSISRFSSVQLNPHPKFIRDFSVDMFTRAPGIWCPALASHVSLSIFLTP